eukprot:3031827-Prymnesium_polylepis.1
MRRAEPRAAVARVEAVRAQAWADGMVQRAPAGARRLPRALQRAGAGRVPEHPAPRQASDRRARLSQPYVCA